MDNFRFSLTIITRIACFLVIMNALTACGARAPDIQWMHATKGTRALAVSGICKTTSYFKNSPDGDVCSNQGPSVVIIDELLPVDPSRDWFGVVSFEVGGCSCYEPIAKVHSDDNTKSGFIRLINLKPMPPTGTVLVFDMDPGYIYFYHSTTPYPQKTYTVHYAGNFLRIRSAVFMAPDNRIVFCFLRAQERLGPFCAPMSNQVIVQPNDREYNVLKKLLPSQENVGSITLRINLKHPRTYDIFSNNLKAWNGRSFGPNDDKQAYGEIASQLPDQNGLPLLPITFGNGYEMQLPYDWVNGAHIVAYRPEVSQPFFVKKFPENIRKAIKRLRDGQHSTQEHPEFPCGSRSSSEYDGYWLEGVQPDTNKPNQGRAPCSAGLVDLGLLRHIPIRILREDIKTELFFVRVLGGKYAGEEGWLTMSYPEIEGSPNGARSEGNYNSHGSFDYYFYEAEIHI